MNATKSIFPFYLEAWVEGFSFSKRNYCEHVCMFVLVYVSVSGGNVLGVESLGVQCARMHLNEEMQVHMGKQFPVSLPGGREGSGVSSSSPTFGSCLSGTHF